ncbi:MAG: DUF4931 domain-containing protein [Selenomonadaceae bacterium]|nr:DUF4931 domain-containing protein [Selenomonadaceae bacterium]
MNINLIKFNTDVGKTKPENIVNKNNSCPFCDVEKLTDIIDTDGDIIFLKNKYNVIENADQFVLIEGADCYSDMPKYSREHMHRVIKMGVKHWKKLLNSGKYEEVLFFKNFGPMSGGTIRHPHMQIVGFPKLNSELLFDVEELQGLVIAKKNGVELNISNCPRVGFGELNIIVEGGGSLETLADFLQIGVHYLMNHFRKNLQSYNIFFYRRDEKIFAKMMPRFATSPYFVGYNIHFLPRNIYQIAEEVKKIYFSDSPS